MRESQTAVLERGKALEGEFATEPFEVAWATEARWFVQFLEEGTGTVSFRTQISPDGLVWMDHESEPVQGPQRGVLTSAVTQFGHWLRLVVTPEGTASTPLTRVCLALKE
ncbi:hypothetical protein [Streptomyces sp. NPDC056061]|uniref:hypothetical protein n=1 Tax=Streptomyces sp. NPDC056061 TaxID=3345700 RepID=UPI0035D816F0